MATRTLTLWWQVARLAFMSKKIRPEGIVPEPYVESNAEARTVKQVFAVAIDQENEIDLALKGFLLHKAVRVCAWISPQRNK